MNVATLNGISSLASPANSSDSLWQESYREYMAAELLFTEFAGYSKQVSFCLYQAWHYLTRGSQEQGSLPSNRLTAEMIYDTLFNSIVVPKTHISKSQWILEFSELSKSVENYVGGKRDFSAPSPELLENQLKLFRKIYKLNEKEFKLQNRHNHSHRVWRVPFRAKVAVAVFGFVSFFSWLVANHFGLFSPVELGKTSFHKDWIVNSQQGWGQLSFGTSVVGRPLSIGGTIYAEGLGTHANSRIELVIPAGKKVLSGKCGCDDEVGKNGSIICQIAHVDKILFESPVMRGGDSAFPFSIPVEGLEKIALIIHPTADGNDYDHADWVDLGIR